jgi:TPP-dependent trihydroxycyclohexane-1,2-dione (THcHDO) dehydratase
MNNVHDSGVFGWIKQADVPFMHSQAGKPSVCGSFSQDLAGISIPLNSGNWSVSENEVCKQSASVAGEKVHGSEFIHAGWLGW